LYKRCTVTQTSNSNIKEGLKKLKRTTSKFSQWREIFNDCTKNWLQLGGCRENEFIQISFIETNSMTEEQMAVEKRHEMYSK